MFLREKILESTIEVFNEKGLKFTMDDVAKKCRISKKTIYKEFKDKDDMFLRMVDYLFDSIKDAKEAIVKDETLTLEEKIKKIMCVMPEGYKDIDFRQLYRLKDKHPETYKKVEYRLSTGWDDTIRLLEEGKKEGIIKDVNIPLLKMMLESSIEQFFTRNILIENGLSYQEGLDEVVDILINGIIEH